MEQLFSPKTLSAYIGMAEQSIYNRHSSGGDLPPVIKLGRLLRFHPADVRAWLDAKLQPNTVTTPLPGTNTQPKRRGRPTKAKQIEARRTKP